MQEDDDGIPAKNFVEAQEEATHLLRSLELFHSTSEENITLNTSYQCHIIVIT